MDNQYLDQIEKAAYYKERIMKALISKGLYPDSLEVEKRMSKLNTSLSIFRTNYAVAGETFDTEEFNEGFLRIMNDIRILYKIAYQLSMKEYEDIRAFAEAHLTEFENMAKRYEYKTKYEIDSTYLGDTIFYQASGFSEKIENTVATIDLGKVKTAESTKLACLFDGVNITPDQVLFNFDGKNCTPYSLNRDFFKVPGSAGCVSYSYELPEGTTVTSAFKIQPNDFVPSAKNKYVIYGGAGYITCATGKEETPLVSFKKKTGYAMSFSSGCRIIFYILNGSYASFEYSVKPVRQSFIGTSINDMGKRQKVEMEFNAPFTLNFDTNGTVYATRKLGIVKNDCLYYPDTDQLSSFTVEEFKTGKSKEYEDVKVTISGLTEDSPLIVNMIAIKQLSAIEGVDDLT